MDARGERIIVFGDSLSHHGSDNAPEIWDVDQGSSRASGQPGDLLASLLAEQGAEVVRVNARVGRSAVNFWGREPTAALLQSDAVFKPTKVIVFLGTNDIGMGLAADRAAMVQIRDAYKNMGAEVWAIGPVAYVSPSLNAQAVPIADMMKDVFAGRFIDPRPVTATTGRAHDGVHFSADSARTTALGLADLLISTASPKNWMPVAIGAAAVVGVGLIWSWYKNKSPRSLSGLGEAFGAINPEVRARYDRKPDLAEIRSRRPRPLHKLYGKNPTPEQIAASKAEHSKWNSEYRKASKEHKAAVEAMNAEIHRERLGLGARLEVPGHIDQRFKRHYQELLEDPDPAATDVLEDELMQNDVKLSKISQTLSDRHGSFRLTPLDPKKDETQNVVHWRIYPESGRCRAEFNVILDGKRVGGPAHLVPSRGRPPGILPIEDSRRFEMHYSGGEEYCRTSATADAWALVKRVKQIKAHKRAPAGEALLARTEKEINFVLGQDNWMNKGELYGAADRKLTDDEIMSVANDAALERKFDKALEILGDREMPKIATSFRKMTPESAEDGDYAETGWKDQDGDGIEINEYDIEEQVDADSDKPVTDALVAKAVKWLRREGAQADGSFVSKNTWYSTTAPDQTREHFEQGVDVYYDFFPREFTEDEARAIFQQIKLKRY